MGTGAFIYATNFSEYGIIGAGILGPGPFIMCVIIRTYQEARYKLRTGSWFKPKSASRVINPDGSVKWRSAIPLVISMTTNFSYILVMTLGWKFAEESGMNQGVISTLLSMASLFNIITFYFKFGEKISCLHFIGVAFMIACIICISLEATSKTEEDEEDLGTSETLGVSKLVAGVLAVLCGLAGAILMSTKHFFIRIYKANYSGLDMGIDSNIIEYFICILFLFPLSHEVVIGWKEIGIGCVAGILICLARICIAIGVSQGLAGPS